MVTRHRELEHVRLRLLGRNCQNCLPQWFLRQAGLPVLESLVLQPSLLSSGLGRSGNARALGLRVVKGW